MEVAPSRTLKSLLDLFHEDILANLSQMAYLRGSAKTPKTPGKQGGKQLFRDPKCRFRRENQAFRPGKEAGNLARYAHTRSKTLENQHVNGG